MFKVYAVFPGASKRQFYKTAETSLELQQILAKARLQGCSDFLIKAFAKGKIITSFQVK
jgi:hypothetical protein